jgi:HK97 family phage portal protein
MSILTPLVEFFRPSRSTFFRSQKKSYEDLDGWFGLGYSQTVAGVPVNEISALQQSVVLACVQIISSDIAKLPIRLYEKLENGKKRLAKNHYLSRLFRSPNDYQTWHDFCEFTLVNLIVNGNAYAVILRDGAGVPVALIPINAQHVQLRETAEDPNSWFYNVSRQGLHELAVLRDMPMSIHRDDVLHFKWLSYINGLFGTNRVLLAKEQIGLALGLEEASSRFVGQGSRLSGFIKRQVPDKPGVQGKETIERIQAAWNETFSGPRNTGGLGVLPVGAEFQSAMLSFVDTQFVEQSRFQVEQIARYFRVPLSKLGIADKSEAASGLVQLETEYFNSCLSSYTERMVQTLYKQFEIDADDYEIAFDFEGMFKADLQTRINTANLGFTGSVFTVNENRAANGLPPVPDGDLIYVPANMVPLGTLPQQNESDAGIGSDQSGRPARGGDGDEGAPDTPADDPDDRAPSI